MIRFTDRREAGELLARALNRFAGLDNAVLYALPRGGVPVAAEISRALNIPMDIEIARKIGHPQNPELAIGATTENGRVVWGEEAETIRDDDWIAHEVDEARQEAHRRREEYLHDHKHIPATGKVAILVDDGLATGLTVRAAANELELENPLGVAIAVPVGPHEEIERLRNEGYRVITIDEGYDFPGGISAYYEQFPELSDEEVEQTIAEVQDVTGEQRESVE